MFGGREEVNLGTRLELEMNAQCEKTKEKKYETDP